MIKISKAAVKVYNVIVSCKTASHVHTAGNMVSAFRKLYSLHIGCNKFSAILCRELQGAAGKAHRNIGITDK